VANSTCRRHHRKCRRRLVGRPVQQPRPGNRFAFYPVIEFQL